MRTSLTPLQFGPAVAVSFVLVGAAVLYLEPAAAGREAVRDLETVGPAEVGISAERLQRFDDGMQGMVDDGKLAGVVTMLARHGKTAFVDVAGARDLDTEAPMTRDSIFRIYSMSKPITGVAMMMLYEEGRWRLNDPVSKYIPAFADLKVHVGDKPDGSLRLEDADRSMTMRELMSHFRGARLRSGKGQRRRPTLSQAPGTERGCSTADDDRHTGDAATVGATRDAVVLQYLGRRAGLLSRTAVGTAARPIPEDTYF